MIASINYERVIAQRGNQRLLAHGGLGYFPMWANGALNAGNVVVPLGLRGLCGLGAHHLEAGLGFTVVVTGGEIRNSGLDFAMDTFVTPSVGYRYANFIGGRLSLGAAYAPRISYGIMGLSYVHYFRAGIGMMF